MLMTIETAVGIARTLASTTSPMTIPGGLKVAVTEVISARHSSVLGKPGDYWIVTFRLDWGMAVEPASIRVHVDSSTGEAKYEPTL